jgi:hypothetical protein
VSDYDDPSYAEVHNSSQFQMLALILDEETAYQYARAEIIAERERAKLEAPPAPSYKDWYLSYLRSAEWRARADTAKARFGNRCALCNSEGPLEAHHRTYERAGDELPEDIVALCADCHRAFHRWRLGLS